MPSLHLTDLAVQRLKDQGEHYDTTTPAFGIRVGKNRKTWFVIRGKERLRTTIGRYPDVPLAEARKAARKLLTTAPERNANIKFGEAYERFKVHIAAKKPRTQKDYKRHLDKHFVPKFEKKRLSDLTYEGITEAVAHLPPGERAHALAVARIFLRWCVKPPRRYLTHNPLEGVQIAASKKRRRILTPEELLAVWKAASVLGYPYGPIVQLLILTGQRKSEIANLRHEWLNRPEKTATLPAWVTKNSKVHTFPYGDMVEAILEKIPVRNSTDLLFPSEVADDRPISGWSKYKGRLDALSGVKGHTLHDLRRTYRTLHASIGTPREIGERLVNHAAAVTTDVEEVYDVYTYMPEMRTAVANYEAHLTQLLARH
jgi:integrase